MKIQRRVLSLVFALIAVIVGSFISSSIVTFANARYVVQQGDTLWHIAATHDVSVGKLIANNHLTSDLIQVHQLLLIPTKRSERHASSHNQKSHASKHKPSFVALHTVQSGDTLWQLSITNHTSVSRLMAINHLQSDRLYPGQRLRVYSGLKSAWVKQQDKLYAEKGLPVELVSVYQAAGRRFGIPWTVLAAIHHEETNYSTSGDEISPAGAIGPMQFMPSTFEYYAVAAPGQKGAPDIHNVKDAIYTCAHMLAEDGFSRNPSAALYLYNHSMQYVESVQSYAESV